MCTPCRRLLRVKPGASFDRASRVLCSTGAPEVVGSAWREERAADEREEMATRMRAVVVRRTIPTEVSGDLDCGLW